MKIIDSDELLNTIEKGLVLSIGNFDGFHLGHQDIVAAAKKAAWQTGSPGVAVMTFDPHPESLLRPDRAPGVLTPLCVKKQLLAGAGIDYMIVIKDSMNLLNQSPKDFIDEFLMRTLRPSVVVEGPNFNFGYGRSGNVDTLRELGSLRGFEVIEVPFRQVHLHDRRAVVCSSTLIRTDLEDGNVKAADTMLSRPYRLIGKVVKGRGIGRKIGFPTANIDPIKQVIPAEGVYAGFVSASDSLEEAAASDANRPAAVSIGRAKTFLENYSLLLEAHILKENVEDLVGKRLSIDFVDRIREQKRFENEELLKDQITKDCKRARNVLKK